MKGMGVIILIISVLFLLRDLNVWSFWNIQWPTMTFILGDLSVACTGKWSCGASACSCETKAPRANKKK